MDIRAISTDSFLGGLDYNGARRRSPLYNASSATYVAQHIEGFNDGAWACRVWSLALKSVHEAYRDPSSLFVESFLLSICHMTVDDALYRGGPSAGKPTTSQA